MTTSTPTIVQQLLDLYGKLADHDARLARIERHLGLAPLDPGQ
jgi:hypothetical protein